MTQALFILFFLLMPVLNILRYDTDTHDLIILGSSWSLGLEQGFYADQSAGGALHIAVQFFLKAILPWILLLALFPLLGFLTGRFFCGWLCPEGALFEYADFLTLKLLGRRSLFGRTPGDPDVPLHNRIRYGTLAVLSIIVIPLVNGAALTGFFVAPKTIWHQIVTWNFTFGVKAGILGVAIYMIVTSVFVRHVLCKFVCAAGLMQMLFGWLSPISLRLWMETERISECTDCKGCDRACFMGVTPRKNKRDISCVNCGACVSACTRELGEGKGLFHLSFGVRRDMPRVECKKISARETINV